MATNIFRKSRPAFGRLALYLFIFVKDTLRCCRRELQLAGGVISVAIVHKLGQRCCQRHARCCLWKRSVPPTIVWHAVPQSTNHQHLL